ncbi:DUF3923 family protein [Sporosarcina sp. Sa2YVA2]|uniref:DUF3923 family protein n=1 Tax=Sporosarcina quadrami TaxID=2762234 RepID=A0ABR8UB84_9BACL|nr:DUF3923 family protein [Sporosarcina quadrami]MBD7985295.1 DUF3923 family protein [Sporosarcina quadrami]
MKKQWLFWWFANIFWIATFTVGTVALWLREVDGAGVTQTPVAKLAAIIVLLIAFTIPLIIQVVWLIINLVISINNKTNIQ